jgi:Fe-Mn family superoxide dismutase
MKENKFTVKNYSHLQNIGKISNEAMNMHFKLYEGYVKNTNTLIEKFEYIKTFDAEYSTKFLPEWTEMHRRFGWEFNGMRLHELFFDSLTVEVKMLCNELEGEIKNKIIEDFRSIESWKEDFVKICKMRGMGWTMLVQDNNTGKLINTWVNEHDAGMMADVKIILNVDMFEHAYVKDFGTDRVPYIESIFAHIDWEVVSSRLITNTL